MNLVSLVRRLPHRRLLPAYWIALSSIVVAVDYLLGPLVQFPIFFVVPVGLASWYSGLRWGIPLAAILPLFRLHSVSLWGAPWEFGYSILNAVIRIVLLVGVAVLLERLALKERELEQRLATLEGLLPICSGCKKIRDENEEWQPLERYISERTNAEFTHGMCPTCVQRYFDEYSEGEV